jgi:hypothetical protein
MWEKFIPAASALLGGLLGTVLTLANVGRTEAEKLAQLNRAKALSEFAEAAWGPGTDDARIAYDRKVSALTVYASPDVIRTHAAWVQKHCIHNTRSHLPECQRAWADVVAAMRADAGRPPVEAEHIIDAIWERPAQPASGR